MPEHHVSRRTLWLTAGLAVGVCAFILIRVLTADRAIQQLSAPASLQTHQQTSRSAPMRQACTSEPLYSVLPVTESDFFAFRPLGWLTPPTIVFPLKHSTFSITQPGEASYRRVPVVFPGGATVTRINTTEWLGKNKTGYQLYFDPCQGVQAYFYHLGNLAEPLLTALTNYAGEPNCRQYYAGYDTDVKLCQYQVSIPVKAGDPAGVSGDGASVDFGMIDYNAPELVFANRDHYTDELRHYVSPLNYFTPEMKARLLAKTGSYDGQVIRTKEPREGEIAQDIAGTAQGNWFEPGKDWNQFPPPDNATFIALVHDYIGPEPIFSMGTRLPGVKPGLYSFTPESIGSVNRDFADVKSDIIYCYDRFTNGQTTGKVGLGQIEGILILKLSDDANTFTIEKIGTAGTTCHSIEWLFSKNAVTYSR